MSNDPFADQPGEHGSDWGGDPSAGPPPPPPGAAPGWGADPGAGAIVGPASVGKRVGAYIIDGLGLAIVGGILLVILGFNIGGYAANLIMTVAVVAYFGLMEGSAGGQTIAKKLFRIKVVSANGSPATLQATVMRRLPFVVGSIIPGALGGLIGFVLVLVILITTIQNEPEHRGFHDNWAGTKVIDA